MYLYLFCPPHFSWSIISLFPVLDTYMWVVIVGVIPFQFPFMYLFLSCNLQATPLPMCHLHPVFVVFHYHVSPMYIHCHHHFVVTSFFFIILNLMPFICLSMFILSLFFSLCLVFLCCVFLCCRVPNFFWCALLFYCCIFIQCSRANNLHLSTVPISNCPL